MWEFLDFEHDTKCSPRHKRKNINPDLKESVQKRNHRNTIGTPKANKQIDNDNSSNKK